MRVRRVSCLLRIVLAGSPIQARTRSPPESPARLTSGRRCVSSVSPVGGRVTGSPDTGGLELISPS
jgi:hypothetical protein